MEVKYTEWNCSSCWKFRNERECVPDQDPSTDSCLNHETAKSKAEMDKLKEERAGFKSHAEINLAAAQKAGRMLTDAQALWQGERAVYTTTINSLQGDVSEAREWAKTLAESQANTAEDRVMYKAVVDWLKGDGDKDGGRGLTITDTMEESYPKPDLATRLFQIAVVVLLIGIASWPYIINNNIRGCEKQFSLLRSELVMAESRRDSLLAEGAFVWGVVLPGSVDVAKSHAQHKVTKPDLRK